MPGDMRLRFKQLHWDATRQAFPSFPFFPVSFLAHAASSVREDSVALDRTRVQHVQLIPTGPRFCLCLCPLRCYRLRATGAVVAADARVLAAVGRTVRHAGGALHLHLQPYLAPGHVRGGRCRRRYSAAAMWCRGAALAQWWCSRVWHSGGAATYDAVVVWCGGVAVVWWRSRGMVLVFSGGVVAWWFGGSSARVCGGVARAPTLCERPCPHQGSRSLPTRLATV